MSQHSQSSKHSQNIQQLKVTCPIFEENLKMSENIKKEQINLQEHNERQFNVLQLNENSLQTQSNQSEPIQLKIENENTHSEHAGLKRKSQQNIDNGIHGQCEQIIISCASSDNGQKQQMEKQDNLPLSEIQMEIVQIELQNNPNQKQNKQKSQDAYQLNYETQQKQHLQKYQFKMESQYAQCNNSVDQYEVDKQQNLSALQCPPIIKTKSEPNYQSQKIIEKQIKPDSSNINVKQINQVTKKEQNQTQIFKQIGAAEQVEKNNNSSKHNNTITTTVIIIAIAFLVLLIILSVNFQTIKKSIEYFTLILLGISLILFFVLDHQMRKKTKIEQVQIPLKSTV